MEDTSRRTTLKALGATLGAAAFARAMAPLAAWPEDLSMSCSSGTTKSSAATTWSGCCAA